MALVAFFLLILGSSLISLDNLKKVLYIIRLVERLRAGNLSFSSRGRRQACPERSRRVEGLFGSVLALTEGVEGLSEAFEQ